MTCRNPQCCSQRFSVSRTRRGDDSTQREVRCRDCGTRYRSSERITHIYVSTPEGERAITASRHARLVEAELA